MTRRELLDRLDTHASRLATRICGRTTHHHIGRIKQFAGMTGHECAFCHCWQSIDQPTTPAHTDADAWTSTTATTYTIRLPRDLPSPEAVRDTLGMPRHPRT